MLCHLRHRDSVQKNFIHHPSIPTDTQTAISFDLDMHACYIFQYFGTVDNTLNVRQKKSVQ